MIDPHNTPYKFHVALFRNQSSLNLTGWKTWATYHISHFSPHVKFRGVMGKISEAEFQIQHRTQSLI